MALTITVAAITCLLMILSVLFFPAVRIKKFGISTYWLITLLGAVVLLATRSVDIKTVGQSLIANTAINPLKILVLFLSMTVLSVFLDELGFFGYLASVVLKKARGGQKKLFLILYLTVSVLTVFTSNDIIILSFTPFVCYFCKNAKIDPIPYLSAEFVAANTWSMLLIIGNPTNIYLATAYGIDFLSYLKVSFIPALFAGVVAFGMLFLLFRKKLSTPIESVETAAIIKDKTLLGVGLACLGACTLILAISSYIKVEMWIVSLCAMALLFLITGAISLFRKKPPKALLGCLKRAPYPLIPFMISMFVIIIALEQNGVTAAIASFMGSDFAVVKYGVASFLSANLINNIPMSVLFSSIISALSGKAALSAMFATVIGSNLGAFFTPIGALAGIMFGSILKVNGIKYGYLDFLKIGVTVGLPTLFAALGGLCLSLLI